MRIIRDLQQAGINGETVLTIGAFDGLHLGHQELLKHLIRRARETGRLSGMVTFHPPPRQVLYPTSTAICLISVEDKAEILQEWHLDLLAILPFTLELARTPARDFVQGLVQHLHMTELWVGQDFALGHGRTGNVAALQKMGPELGFHLHVVQPVTDGEVVISSTEIRNLISAGRVAQAAQMLGRYHRLRGTVRPERRIGHRLGFPTANVQLGQPCAMPATGVYAVYATFAGQRHPAAANIGYRPTFQDQEPAVVPAQPTLEVHVLDFEGEMYGQEMTVEFVERLRDERRFASAEALQAQIRKDIARARDILE
jgi:riboflavin kinase/FMN adenylyltransferase